MGASPSAPARKDVNDDNPTPPPAPARTRVYQRSSTETPVVGVAVIGLGQRMTSLLALLMEHFNTRAEGRSNRLVETMQLSTDETVVPNSECTPSYVLVKSVTNQNAGHTVDYDSVMTKVLEDKYSTLAPETKKNLLSHDRGYNMRSMWNQRVKARLNQKHSHLDTTAATRKLVSVHDDSEMLYRTAVEIVELFLKSPDSCLTSYARKRKEAETINRDRDALQDKSRALAAEVDALQASNRALEKEKFALLDQIGGIEAEIEALELM
eukprot:TRINITY_DN6740_c0_g2_i4.p1 TRINITY_DN6740_c0_g2~~TRINITY_DN6740_c0_g2_i4.p1  ORF type:complete len:267 (-),score=30.33 TRINITY_DN6740_c0_g2_i4:49-849(-)